MIKYIAAAMIVATPVMAQETQCASTNDAYDVMSHRFGEDRQTIGVTQGGALVEQWANEQTGSWTIVVSDPVSRVTCIVAEGVGFDYVSPPNL